MGTGYLFPFTTPLILIKNSHNNYIFTVDEIGDCVTFVDEFASTLFDRG